VCPYDAAKTIKPIEGRLMLYRVHRCDPIGCRACVNVCKNGVWWISNGIHFNSDFCIYCGACENACPYNLIEVKRSSYRITSNDSPWTEAWKKAVDRIVSKRRVEEVGEEEEGGREEGEGVEQTSILEQMSQQTLQPTSPLPIEALNPIEQALKIPLYRKALEKGDIEVFLKGVRGNLEG